MKTYSICQCGHTRSQHQHKTEVCEAKEYFGKLCPCIEFEQHTTQAYQEIPVTKGIVKNSQNGRVGFSGNTINYTSKSPIGYIRASGSKYKRAVHYAGEL